MTTAIQILSVERRLLTITLKYAIITAEKEFMRSRILDFLIASISHRNGLDHIFDHLRLWTTWKQCLQEHPKASFSDTKAPKSLVNQAKNRCRFVWDVDAAGSNPVTPTKKPRRGSPSPWLFSIDVPIQSCFAKQKQVRIPRSKIDKLACQAEGVGITERSGVTLSLRPKLALESNFRSLFLCLLRRKF